MNIQYFSASEIYARLSAEHKGKMSEYERYTIMRWCAEVQTELIRDPSHMTFRKISIGVPKNMMVRVPMEVSKIERVYNGDTGSLLQYSFNGEYVFLSERDKDVPVALDCYTHVLDDDGFPMIARGLEKACEAYCLYKMYHEDYLDGKINGQQWQDISNAKDWELAAAANAWDEVDDSFVQDVMDAMVNPAYKKMAYGTRK